VENERKISHKAPPKHTDLDKDHKPRGWTNIEKKRKEILFAEVLGLGNSFPCAFIMMGNISNVKLVLPRTSSRIKGPTL
jgi:hypothetical protein